MSPGGGAGQRLGAAEVRRTRRRYLMKKEEEAGIRNLIWESKTLV